MRRLPAPADLLHPSPAPSHAGPLQRGTALTSMTRSCTDLRKASSSSGEGGMDSGSSATPSCGREERTRGVVKRTHAKRRAPHALPQRLSPPPSTRLRRGLPQRGPVQLRQQVRHELRVELGLLLRQAVLRDLDLRRARKSAAECAAEPGAPSPIDDPSSSRCHGPAAGNSWAPSCRGWRSRRTP
jgi:hypothetical protein